MFRICLPSSEINLRNFRRDKNFSRDLNIYVINYTV